MWKAVVDWSSNIKRGDVFVNNRHEYYVVIKEMETGKKMNCLVLTVGDNNVARVVGSSLMDSEDLMNKQLFTKREDVKVNIEISGFNV